MSGVDPRACGVDIGKRLIRRGERGGSPRMRGRLDVPAEECLRRRWIPAHAG